MSPRANEAWNITRDKNDKTEAILLWAQQEKAEFFGKDNNAIKKKKRAEKKTKYEMR